MIMVNEKTVQDTIAEQYALAGKNVVNDIFNLLQAEKQKASSAYSKVVKIEYTDANRLELTDSGIIYDQITLVAPSTNSATVYVGGSNPVYPLGVNDSTTLRKKKLYNIYLKGSVGDTLIILC